jgi:hypothetical protein
MAFALFLFAILGNHMAASEENPEDIEDTLGSYLYFSSPSGNANSTACALSLQLPL